MLHSCGTAMGSLSAWQPRGDTSPKVGAAAQADWDSDSDSDRVRGRVRVAARRAGRAAAARPGGHPQSLHWHLFFFDL